MTIKQFIEKGIEGGYPQDLAHYEKYPDQCVVLLDPLAWQAVGKVEGWETKYFKCSPNCDNKIRSDDWNYQMHRMIDALAEGKTIEEFIETL